MAKHAQTDTGQRVKRTAFAAVLGVVVVIVIALPEVLRIFDAELGEFLPDHIRAWLLGAAAVALRCFGGRACLRSRRYSFWRRSTVALSGRPANGARSGPRRSCACSQPRASRACASSPGVAPSPNRLTAAIDCSRPIARSIA